MPESEAPPIAPKGGKLPTVLIIPPGRRAPDDGHRVLGKFNLGIAPFGRRLSLGLRCQVLILVGDPRGDEVTILPFPADRG